MTAPRRDSEGNLILTLPPHQCEMLYALLSAVAPKGYNQKQFYGSLLCALTSTAKS